MLKLFLHIFFAMLQFLYVSGQNKIVGGEEIDIKVVPYMLSIMLDGNHICGAGIISKNWAITAAHCIVETFPKKTMQVRSGSSNRLRGGTIHDVIEINTHEKYLSVNDNYDIAVFKVFPPFIISKVAQPLRLPKDYKTTDMKWGLVAGWGYFIIDDPVLSENLLFIILPKVDDLICQEDFIGIFEIKSNEICYGLRMGGKDSCKGDSGGPLVNPDRMIIGITSWGNSCALPGSPGVYLNVLNFVNWIKNKTGL